MIYKKTKLEKLVGSLLDWLRDSEELKKNPNMLLLYTQIFTELYSKIPLNSTEEEIQECIKRTREDYDKTYTEKYRKNKRRAKNDT